MLTAKDKSIFSYSHAERKNSTLEKLRSLTSGKSVAWNDYQKPKLTEQRSQDSVFAKEPKLSSSGSLPEPILKRSDSYSQAPQALPMKIIGKKIK